MSVNTTGHEIYAFVNGKLAGECFDPANSRLFSLLLYFTHQPDGLILIIGRQHSPNGDFIFQLESPVKLHDGKNYLSLLSATIGLKVEIRNQPNSSVK